MELNIIKIDLEMFKTEDSLISFCSIHGIDRKNIKDMDIFDVFPSMGIRYIIYDINNQHIIAMIEDSGDVVSIDGILSKTCDYMKPINILTLPNKPKSLIHLPSLDLEKELELCLESEDYDRAIIIRKLLKNKK